jgi:curli biogenesis system outer membrane secretion channel CsgG
VSAPDPNQDQFPTLDARFVLKGEGRKGADGVVFGNQSLKIGAPIELEGSDFRVTGSVTGLQVGS